MAPDSNDNDVQKKVELHERLATIEELLRHLVKEQEDQKECDEKLDEKIDKILENDKDKLQRITKNEQTIKNVKAILWLFLVPIAAAIARWFV
jgi:hypothetical protein